MTIRAILFAALVASVLLVGAAGTVVANGDHDHGDDGDEDGGLPGWVPDPVADLLKTIGGLVGGTGAHAGYAVSEPVSGR